MKYTFAVLGVALAITSGSAVAAVSTEEANQLGTTLTRFGANPSANADGSIPPYNPATAKITPPSSYKPGSARYPSPFEAEKPLFTITAQNMAQYAEKLDEGAKALLKRFPETYKLNVYPTHRTAPYPAWVLDNTLRNATQAKLINDQGDGVENAYGGIPFPIPKKGLEILWNHLLAWQPTYEDQTAGYMVDSSGGVTTVGMNLGYFYTPYYNADKTALDGPNYRMMLNKAIGPARRAGEAALSHYPMNYAEQAQNNWSYSPGQRRVRLAPEFTYDTPAATYGGGIFWDEIFLFSGRPDKFDWKLVGKKELYIPYNANDIPLSKPDDILGKKHLNPERVRWELHRVWQVEAVLKPGQRHAYSKRIFSFDEDSWRMVSAVGYDQAGEVYRAGYSGLFQVYDGDNSFMFNPFWVYDLSKGQYLITPLWGDTGFLRPIKPRGPTATTPSAMQGSGIR
ncbi:DUF1329 domain-containing protein [Pseudomonas sp. CG7]|uniref:DUF1329 domain-containing protein n=1 Tax=Pseudomonas sp. CG7 TaxID=191007 RepID=UPI0020332119|nr:DUF1329 domain-containing protein [Pseudomonas sp. CG7]MCM2459320.1 DUF1329 domain-containing protein [Pseudomonas sp. CG7]